MKVANIFCLFLTSFFIFSCPFNLSAQKNSHDNFVIHSIPKCGTHFIQRIINLLTKQDIFNAQISENSLSQSSNEGIILRTHEPYSAEAFNLLINKDFKMIAMFRDPRDALISHLFYMRTFAGKGRKRDFFVVSENFDELSFDEQLTLLITGTHDMESYLEYYFNRIKWVLKPYTLSVKYEDLVGSEGGGDDVLQRQAILDIANYIGLELSENKLNFVLNNMYVKKPDVQQDGNVFSRATSGNWKNFFKPSHTKLFKGRLKFLLVKLGYEKNSTW